MLESVPPDLYVQVGRRIRFFRRKQRSTQRQLAARAELARQTLSDIERGKQDVGVNLLGRIVKALGVTMAEFFEGM
jgi:transcriptional regulator with XRE-family HTH domain